jgi:hypothetical protein
VDRLADPPALELVEAAERGDAADRREAHLAGDEQPPVLGAGEALGFDPVDVAATGDRREPFADAGVADVVRLDARKAERTELDLVIEALEHPVEVAEVEGPEPRRDDRFVALGRLSWSGQWPSGRDYR